MNTTKQMNQRELVEILSKKTNLHKAKVDRVLRALKDQIIENTLNDTDTFIIRLGKFGFYIKQPMKAGIMGKKIYTPIAKVICFIPATHFKTIIRNSMKQEIKRID